MLEDPDIHAWVVSADMGLGHQRATAPLQAIAEEGILTAGSAEFSAPAEKKLWDRTRRAYETISRARSIPIIGKPLFDLLDELQKIAPFYPLRDLSRPTYQVKLINALVRKGIGAGLIEKLRTRPLPMVTSFMIPAVAADAAGYAPIYCIICDAEISRAWVAKDPAASRIRYLVPCGRALRRLKSYGVPDDRIFMTGFPLPLEVLGNRDLDVLRADMAQRLLHLDPNNRFWPLHGLNVAHFLGKENCCPKQKRPLTLTYAVGGAGAQREAGRQIAESLRPRIERGEITLNLVAGVRDEIRDYFEQVKADLLPGSDGLRILYAPNKPDYFRLFAQTIRTTDILWTKPSELSFYCGLGIPIIMSPPIGAQERFNYKWLMEIQAGIPQNDPRHTAEWLLDLLTEGRLAEAAWDGFLKARKYGTYKIIDLLKTGTMQHEPSPLKR
ncbi:MAG: hypothetical protein JEZ10_08590 [Verrucomicrobia bacterium]|nr:hypothetical protein [Verrucomicrobiota bacterium]